MRRALVVMVAVLALTPAASSVAEDSAGATFASPRNEESSPADAVADRSAPALHIDLSPNHVFAGTVSFGGTASDDMGVKRVRVAIRDRQTKKWLQRDGTFKTGFARLEAKVSKPGARNVSWHISVDLPRGIYSTSIVAVDTSSNRTFLRPWVRFEVKRASAPTGGRLLAAAGDVGLCSSNDHQKTAAILDDVFEKRQGVVALLGDGAYPDGSRKDYNRCYDKSWGRHLSRTRPTPGNHDYETPGAAGYFSYFGSRAGDADKGYYSYDLGAWRVIVLNSQCSKVGGCDAGSKQYRWLKKELENNPRQCILTYSHRPRYTAGPHSDATALKPLWKLLYGAGADVALAGHNHNYQRFNKMDASGNVRSRGIRSFVVGTGGGALRTIKGSHVGMQFSRDNRHGVLVMNLKDGSYSWEYVAVGGKVLDSGSSGCGA